MDIKQLSTEFSVSHQITQEDIAYIKSLGFTAIVSNRPDNESEDQPSNSAISCSASSHGLEWYHVPMTSTDALEDDVEKLRKILEIEQGPILAFCRTGRRSTTLWACTQLGNASKEEILDAASNVGFDILPYVDGYLSGLPSKDQ